MSYAMCARITFPSTDSRTELKLFYVSSVEIASSWKMLTDTADIVIPRKSELSQVRIYSLISSLEMR